MNLQRTMPNRRAGAWLAGIALTTLFALPFAACVVKEDDGPLEEIGEELDDAAEDVGDAVEDATDGDGG